MCYKPDDYNNEECLLERIQWCQKFLELAGSMVDVIYIDEVWFQFTLWHVVLEGLVEDKDANEIRPSTQRGQNLSLASCRWL